MRLPALLLAASPAFAEPPLTADAFGALTLGRRLAWADYGRVCGGEHYPPDRRVRWTVPGDACMAGHRYGSGGMTCFMYEGDPVRDCWTITLNRAGMIARHSGRPPGAEPAVIEQTDRAPACFGPEVGA